MRLRAIICLLFLAYATFGAADIVTLLDGKMYKGDAALDANGFINVTQLAGTQVRVPLSQVAEATFNSPLALPTPTANGTAGLPSANWVPAPWTSQNVGSVGVLGSAVYATGGQFTLNASGADIGERADSFHFVSQALKVDADLTANIVSITSTDNFAKAGVQIRESLLANARFAMMSASPASGVSFMRRLATGGETKQTARTDIKPPCSLKIGRVGKTVTGSVSTDGEKWIDVGSDTVEFPGAVRIGLAFTSHNNQIIGRAVFDGVELGYGAGTPVPNSFPKGVLATSGSVIPGTIVAANDTSVSLAVNRNTMTVPTVDVARLMFNPLTADKTVNLKPGRAGVLLANGDFFDGEFKAMEGGRLKFSSVLFGLRTFTVSNEVAAVILREVQPASAPFEIRLRDGSILQAKSLAIQSGDLFITDSALGTVHVPLGDLMALKRNSAKPKAAQDFPR